MTDFTDLPPNVLHLLRKAFDNGTNEENYTIEMEEHGETIEGPFGKRLYITLTNKCSGESTHTFIKRNTQSLYHPPDVMRAVFKNEILFYQKIWQGFKQLQNSNMAVEEFTNIPFCYGCCSIAGEEQILLNNIRRINFQHFPQYRALNKEHLEFVFKIYGKFHALSFAFNRIYPEEFSQMISEIYDTFGDFIPYFKKKNADPHLIEKLEIYAKDAPQFMADSLTYRGKHPVICHGDTWSGGQMMFRYHRTLGHLTNMALVNFQMIRTGSPVTDLSYCFYSGIEKHMIHNLEHCLKIYHDTLSESLRQFNIDVNQVYPYSCLKYEWKEYAKFGFLMGLILWSRKLGRSQDENENNCETELSDDDRLTRIRRDHILHMFENDLL